MQGSLVGLLVKGLNQRVSIARVTLSQGRLVTHHSDGQGLGTEHGTGNGGAHCGWGGPGHVVDRLSLESWGDGRQWAAGPLDLRSAG
jgi:hypothetical protein